MLILTAYDNKLTEIGDAAARRIHEYCSRWGHTAQVYRDQFDSGRHPVWSKIKFLLQHIGDHEYILWIDADAFIMRQDFDLTTLIDKQLTIAKDWNGINAGVFAVKGGAYMARFLTALWHYPHPDYHPMREQYVMAVLIEANFLDIQQHINYVPQKIWNAYPYQNLTRGRYLDVMYEPGTSAILHLPGISREQRLQFMRELGV